MGSARAATAANKTSPPHNGGTITTAGWRLALSPADPALLSKLKSEAGGRNGVAIARHLIGALHAAGFTSAHAIVDIARRTIDLKIARFARTGPLSAYLPGGAQVTADRLDAALPLLSAAATAHHEHVNLGLDRSTMTMTPTVTPDAGPVWTLGTAFSSYGPRYAGSDVITNYGQLHADGFDLAGSVTVGLPGLNSDQAGGGNYLGEALSIDHPTTAGIFSVDVGRAHYAVGGPERRLGLTGTVDQITAGDRYPVLDGHVWLKGGFGWASDRERFGILAWTTTQQNASAYVGANAGYKWRGVSVSLKTSIWQGLAGSDDASGSAPNIMGAWSAHYTLERIHLAVARDVGPVRLSGIFGYQHGSTGTPTAMQAYVGGEHRGSSFYTGSFSAPSGYWWSAEIAKAKPVRLKLQSVRMAFDPYVGVNGGTVFHDVGGSSSIAAVTVGVSFAISRHLNGSIVWSHTIAQPAVSHQGNMFNFDIVSRF